MFSSHPILCFIAQVQVKRTLGLLCSSMWLTQTHTRTHTRSRPATNNKVWWFQPVKIIVHPCILLYIQMALQYALHYLNTFYSSYSPFSQLPLLLLLSPPTPPTGFGQRDSCFSLPGHVREHVQLFVMFQWKCDMLSSIIVGLWSQLQPPLGWIQAVFEAKLNSRIS